MIHNDVSTKLISKVVQ
uniref:Uncharacterized protein n=1 Tax=Arundo donax TaxID=35708 RepID=A0A0A9BEF1_ARUDO